MKFIVQRKTWYRGQGAAFSKLLSEDGTRCCIGFVGQQCGIPDFELKGRADIDSLKEHFGETGWPLWMRSAEADGVDNYYGSCAIARCYGINDDPSISDAERERLLKEQFADNGDEIEFVD